MKKFLPFLLSLFLLLGGCSSPDSQTSPKMFIAPASFSEETQDILSLLDQELAFFDYQVDDTVKSMSVDFWAYTENGWESMGRIYGNVDSPQGRIGIQMNDSVLALYQIQENGHTKSSYPNPPGFGNSSLVSATRLSNETPVVLNQEIPLWVQVGTNESYIAVSLSENFREIDCNAGLAVTVTFSGTKAE